MTSCYLVPSDGIDLKAYLITRLNAHCESCILWIQDVEINAVFFNDLNYTKFVISVLYNTCIENLSAACSVERCGFDNDELAVLVKVTDIQDFGVDLLFGVSEELCRFKVAVL